MSTSEQHDILGELFREDRNLAAVPGLEELDSLIHACLAPTAPRPATGKKVLPLKSKAGSSRKKTTHYLREDVFDGLTQAKVILKRLLPEGAKGRASKSNLVNYAVNTLLREIEEKGIDSPIIQRILEKK
ncbi:hypothetical protein SAMN04488082_11954 [Desulfomicrobium apsheronum]|uniref:Uncharacterized protein n=1 Tax=Desulfomicrobium apsheronum TaxID=52560 RepID=A0A1I3YCP3_9BACT|nr:hypothetical protein [Desulfomicrobium apsheronum]MDY0227947.1 hypothetical protein [Desulfomicrobium apsheronum]SFK28966.1 hypothetical protein SAMN04488082_11954 [Desulfomicrobium apsheronum]